VFIGGGVTADGVVAACWEALAPGGRLVANAVTIEGEHALAGWRARLGGTLTRLSVERAGQLGGFTAWRPALPVTQWAAMKAPPQGGLVTVHFVGAGPGAGGPDHRPRAAPAVAVLSMPVRGSLVPAEVLAHCPPDATLTDTADLTWRRSSR